MIDRRSYFLGVFNGLVIAFFGVPMVLGIELPRAIGLAGAAFVMISGALLLRWWHNGRFDKGAAHG